MVNSGVITNTAPNQRMAGGLDAIVKDLNIAPISQIDAKEILIPNHYLHSFPGGTKLSFGVYLDARLLGALTFGVGPYLGYKLVKDASPDDVRCRAWEIKRHWRSYSGSRQTEK